MVKRVRKAAIGAGLTIGVILLLLAASKRFDIGGRLTGAIGGAGSFLPNAAKEFVSQFAAGTGSLGEELKNIGENFQRGIGGGLLFSEQEAFGGGGFVGGTITEESVSTQAGATFPKFLENAFKAFEPVDAKRPLPKAPGAFNVQTAFTPGVQLRRVTQQQQTAATERTGTGQGLTTAFGGFGSALSQESELQKAIAKSRALFPQFFNTGG